MRNRCDGCTASLASVTSANKSPRTSRSIANASSSEVVRPTPPSLPLYRTDYRTGSGDIYELAYSNPIPKWKASVGSAIVVLKVFDLDERGKVVVVGCVDGSAAAWGLSFVLSFDRSFRGEGLMCCCSDWSLIASWSLFASPITEILHLAIPSSPLLRNTLLLISSNSPIALITLTPSPPTLLSIFPGTRSRVESVSTDAKGGELLVIYANGLARVCVVEAQELRRSMDVITARKVLEEGGWKTWFVVFGLR